MKEIHLAPTPKAEWLILLEEAQLLSGYHFNDHVQNYIVVTLDHFTTARDLNDSTLAIDYLEHASLISSRDVLAMRRVGDQCLLLSGLFPHSLSKRNVSLHYIIGIGKQAYRIISETNVIKQYNSQLFCLLCDHFVGIMDLLQHMREIKTS